MEYLIYDCLTGAYTWTAGDTARDALVAHENARRARDGEPPLPEPAKVGQETARGATVIDMWCGESRIRGLRANVVRETA
jgi:hypothetical protein